METHLILATALAVLLGAAASGADASIRPELDMVIAKLAGLEAKVARLEARNGALEARVAGCEQSMPTRLAHGNHYSWGDGTSADGYDAVAINFGTNASEEYSTAMGYQTQASGGQSVAMGTMTQASGFSATAMGGSTTASSDFSVATGDFSVASGHWTTAMGQGSTATANFSVAMGRGAEATEPESLHVSGKVLAKNIAIRADSRLTSNVTTAPAAPMLAALRRLRVVEYSHSTNYCCHSHGCDRACERARLTGLIAQEVERAMPGATSSASALHLMEPTRRGAAMPNGPHAADSRRTAPEVLEHVQDVRSLDVHVLLAKLIGAVQHLATQHDALAAQWAAAHAA